MSGRCFHFFPSFLSLLFILTPRFAFVCFCCCCCCCYCCCCCCCCCSLSPEPTTGIIMSVFSFSSFCFKPVVGYWSDKEGFRIPYFVSITLAILGGFLYVLASALPSSSSSISSVDPPPHRPTAAICGLFAARLFGGCGGTLKL